MLNQEGLVSYRIVKLWWREKETARCSPHQVENLHRRQTQISSDFLLLLESLLEERIPSVEFAVDLQRLPLKSEASILHSFEGGALCPS